MSDDAILANLYEEFNSFDDDSSALEKKEKYFLTLTQLLFTSLLSSSSSITSFCLLTLTKLIQTNFLSQSMETNPSKSNQYYILAMDALIRKENLEYLQGNEKLPGELFAIYTQLYLFMAREIIRFHNRASELLNVREWNVRSFGFEEKYKPLIRSLLTFIDRELGQNNDLSHELYFFVSLSDDINRVPDLLECGLAEHLKTWLNIYNNNVMLRGDDLCDPILITINNIARHENGSTIFKTNEMNDVLQEFWKLYEKNLSKSMIAIYYMAYALIITPDQLKSAIVVHDVIDYLVQNINIASRLITMRTDTAHISEYLVALARLTVNDNVAQYIINKSKVNQTIDGLTFFNGLFEKYHELTPNDLYLKHLSCIALFNIFCSFSFQASVQKNLTANKKFVDIVKKASEYNNNQDVIIQPCMLQHLLTVKQAAEAILINLDLYKDDASVKTTHPRIMISYSHKDAIFCRNLVQSLKSKSIDLWVDEDGHCLSEDCWEEIAIAIKNASIVLVIVSPHYCQSISCRKEATYADKRKKTLIALYPDDNKYDPDEWLDIRLTGTYVRFGDSGTKSFDQCLARLLEYIQPKENQVINALIPPPAISQQPHDVPNPMEVAPILTTPAMGMIKTSIRQWTKDDVQIWFLKERHLLLELYKLYSFVDGDALLEYAKYFIQEYQEDRKQQYEKLRQRLQKEYHIEFYDNNYTDLVSSMKKLLSIYDPQSLSRTKIEKPRSSFCLIL